MEVVPNYGSWSILQTEQGEVGLANVWKTHGGAVRRVRSLTNIYSFIQTNQRRGGSYCNSANEMSI